VSDPVRAVYEAGKELSLALAAQAEGEAGAEARVATAHAALTVATERLSSDEGQQQATDHWMKAGVAKAKAKLPRQ
jgi:peptidyl-tRNA hydrolase